MRQRGLLLGDIRFQFKYGFYYVYSIFLILYIALLLIFPDSWREKAAIIMIFTDPSAMGLFFMGAIVLFEKSERVLNTIAISPVNAYEYVISKLCSIGLISTIVGVILGFTAGIIYNPLSFIIGIFLCSCLFSSIGLIVACKTKTLNQFMLATVPAEILINIPAVFYLFGYKKNWLLLHPGVSTIEIFLVGNNITIAIAVLLLWTLIFAAISCGVVKKMLKTVGGIKL